MVGRILWCVAAALLVVACRDHEHSDDRRAHHAVVGPAAPAPFTDVDRTIDPCDDFYAYTCNTWMGSAELPAGRDSSDRSLQTVSDATTAYVDHLLRDPQTGSGAGSDDRMVDAARTFYEACMDESAIERDGVRPFAPLLDKIAAVHDATSLSRALAALDQADVNVVLGIRSQALLRDSSRVAITVTEGQLGLERSLYTDDSDPVSIVRLAVYEHTLAAFLREIGPAVDSGGDPGAAAHAVVLLETKIVDAMGFPEQQWPPVGVDRLSALAPHVDWATLFDGIGFPHPASFGTLERRYLVELDKLLVATPWRDWRALLASRLLLDYRPMLPARLRDINDPPRERVCADATVSLVPPVGQLFVRDRFGPAAEAAARTMLAALTRAAGDQVARAAWLDPATRDAAAHKLAALTSRLGHPVRWPPYEVAVAPHALAANTLAAARSRVALDTARVGAPVDRDAWSMAVLTLNAYYRPQQNAIEVPAAMLQPPFFDPAQPIAINYGAIGMVIGHELLHAFDDHGATFDATGSRRDWWQPATRDEFERRRTCVVDRVYHYSIDDRVVNGTLTSGEVIADVGGLKSAFAAYRAVRGAVAADARHVEDQQFFLSFARSFCHKARPSWDQAHVNEAHAPPWVRVDDSVASMPEFGAAFGCAKGSRMAPLARCDIW